MAEKTFYMTLSDKSIKACIKWLEQYKKSLQGKTEQFVSELAEVGIVTAYLRKGDSGTFGTHKMENYVSFYKEVEEQKFGCIAIVIGEGQPFTSVWDNGEKSAEIYPLQMIEYGTGAFNIGGERMGSNHLDDSTWYFITNDGEAKLGTAISPTQPMYFAYRQMKLQIVDIAKRVYGS